MITFSTHTLRTLSICLVAFATAGCEFAPRIASDSTFLPHMRGRGAGDAILGSVGFKGMNQGSWFERQRVPNWKSVEVHVAAVVTSNNSVDRKLGELGVTAGTIAEAKLRAGWATTDQYKLTTVQIKDLSALADEIESLIVTDGRLRLLLAQDGIRLVTAVTTIFDSKLTSQAEISLGAKGIATKLANSENLSVSFDAGGSNRYEIKFGDGTAVLYRFSRLCWTPNGKLVALRTDGDGTDGCPEKTTDRLPIS